MKSQYTTEELTAMFASYLEKMDGVSDSAEQPSTTESHTYIHLKDNTENSTKLFRQEAFFQKLYDDNAKVDIEIKKIYDMLNKLSDDIRPVMDELKNELPNIKKLFSNMNGISDAIDELKNTVDAHELQIMEVKRSKQKTFSERLKEKAELTSNIWSITKVTAVVFVIITVLAASAPNLIALLKSLIGAK